MGSGPNKLARSTSYRIRYNSESFYVIIFLKNAVLPAQKKSFFLNSSAVSSISAEVFHADKKKPNFLIFYIKISKEINSCF